MKNQNDPLQLPSKIQELFYSEKTLAEIESV